MFGAISRADFRGDILAFVSTTEKLWQKLEAVASDEGLCLYDLERFGTASLRVFVEKPKTSGERVTSGDCSRLVRRLMSICMAEGPELGLIAEPQIEVSSPGVNRQLRLPQQFAGAVGERVKVTLVESAGGSRAAAPVVGVLSSLNGEVLEILDEATKQTEVLPLAAVGKAHVDFKFD